MGQDVPKQEYNHRMMAFLRVQLDKVQDLEVPPNASSEELETFSLMLGQARRLLTKHTEPFDITNFYKIEDAQRAVEQICQILKGTAQEWGLQIGAGIEDTIPQECVDVDKRHLHGLLAYILKEDSSSPKSQHGQLWEEIKLRNKERLRFLQVINESELCIGQKLGEGGQGTVHEATWKAAKVAVKKPVGYSPLSIEDFAGLTKEAALHAKLRHPNIVSLHAATPSGFLVMELATTDLKTLCQKKGFLSWPVQLRLLLQAASALHYVHSQDPVLVHSDVKSSNFLIFGTDPETFTVKITDFGLAFEVADARSKTVRLGGGTPEWFAPEIYYGKPVTPASDVFSFGVVIYELVTGQHPYGVGLTDRRLVQPVVMNKKLNREEPCHVDPQECPEGLLELMRDCCAYDPKQRPAMDEVCSRLEGLPKDWRPSSEIQKVEPPHSACKELQMQRMQPQCNKFDIRIHSVSHDPTVIVQSTFGPVEVGSFTDEHGDTVPVAVKYGTGLFATRAPQEVVRIFRSELEILHKVPTHPHIVCCYGGRVDFKEGDHIDARDVYIVQELMHNTLEAIIHGDQFDGNIPCNLIIKLALDIASGLEHLQEYSVMHYNLNTANIYLDDSLRNAKISDFGASQVNVESCITDALGGKAGCLGSEVLRKFIAPEVLLSYITKRYMINEKSCVYSLGVVLWEMLQGKLDDQAMEQLGSAESSGVQGFSITRPCPECLVQLVHDCVSMDVSTRPAVHEVRKKLQDMTFLAQWIVDKVEVDFSDGPPGVTQVGSVGVTRVTKAATLTDSVDDEFQEDVRGLNYDIRIHPVSNTPTIIRQDTFGTVELGSFTDEQGEIVQVAVRYFTDLFNTKTAREVAEICRSELKISQRLPMHPNIVCCYGGRVDFKEDECIGDRDVYIVEELMRSSLREMIYGDLFDGKIPIKLILKFALDIASGLEHLHKCSVIHYDLKPANILVGNKLEVAKISDFGISKVKTGSYITGSMHGTFGYMAPEVMVSNFINVDINEKIDIYGLGVIIWEMIEAKPPYDLLDNGSGSTGKSSAIEERFTISRPCPEPLKQLVFDCVSLSSDDRPTAQEARQRLQEMSDTHT